MTRAVPPGHLRPLAEQKHDRTLSGLLEKRSLAPLGEMGLGAEGEAPSVGAWPSETHVAPVSMERYFSVPPPLSSSTAAVSGRAGMCTHPWWSVRPCLTGVRRMASVAFRAHQLPGRELC